MTKLPAEAPAEPERKAGRDALIAYVVVAIAVTGLVRINITLPAIGHLGSALVSVVFLYAPIIYLGRFRDEDIYDYGFRWQPLGKSLGTALVAIAIIFPLFAVGYFAFYEVACHSKQLVHLVPRNMCVHYGGLHAIHAPAMSGKLAEFILVQLLVVALPEELFFRGFLLGLLEKRFPPKRRFLGGGIGLALVLSSLAFALIHLPKDGDPRVLATFFPGLLFGWMRSRTKSIVASTVAHGFSNILIRILDLAAMR
ncbi:MAG TPA: CPBP family intramembrane glutamic endopeptidase [Kofleriaceae bacterium]|nr:CPBP family intramembrane glutamic endopeptidase [Kofleriaceae bacterium]